MHLRVDEVLSFKNCVLNIRGTTRGSCLDADTSSAHLYTRDMSRQTTVNDLPQVCPDGKCIFRRCKIGQCGLGLANVAWGLNPSPGIYC